MNLLEESERSFKSLKETKPLEMMFGVYDEIKLPLSKVIKICFSGKT